MLPNVHSSIVCNTVEGAKMSFNRQMDKEDVVQIHKGILVTRKDESPPFVLSWMELEGIMLSEISQSEKDNYHMVSLICGI